MPGSVRFLCALLLALLFGVTLSPLLSTAQVAADTLSAPQKDQITISPPLQKLTLGPGLLEAKTYIQVTNTTGHTYTATAKLVDFKSLNETGGLTLGQVGVPLWDYGLANWMRVNNTTFSLVPGQTTKLEITIQNRDDLTPGGHYGAVVITGISPDKAATASNQIDFSQNLVSLLFVKKLGGEKYGLTLSSLSIDRGHELPQSVSTTFRSTGNVYVIPRGYIEVKDPHGKLVQKGIINQDSAIIMQGVSQKLITLMQPVADSSANGRFQAIAHYRYEGQTDYSTQTLYFNKGGWLPNTSTIIITTGVILSLLMYLIQRKRHRSKRYKIRAR